MIWNEGVDQSKQDPPERAVSGTHTSSTSWVQRKQKLSTLCPPVGKHGKHTLHYFILTPLKRGGVTFLVSELRTKCWACMDR